MYFHRIQNPQWFALGAMLLVLGSPVEAQQWQEARTAATTLGIQLLSLEVRTSGELDKSSESATRGRVDALLVLRNPLFYVLRKRIVTLAEKGRLPGIYPSKEFVDAGGLMSYGANNDAQYRRAATFVDKILKELSRPSCQLKLRRSSSW